MIAGKRKAKIAERRTEIPRRYRGVYDKAVQGKSRKAAMRAFCLECCGWQVNEVFLCAALACPLYPYRPRSRVPQDTPESIPAEPESQKVE